MSKSNMALIRRYMTEVVEAGDLHVTYELFAPHYYIHGPSAGMDLEGPEGLNGMVIALRTGFPDVRFVSDEMFSVDDRVVYRWRLGGTQTGQFRELPASGKKMEIHGIMITRFEDGKIVEEWESMDMLGMLKQLGALGPTG